MSPFIRINEPLQILRYQPFMFEPHFAHNLACALSGFQGFTGALFISEALGGEGLLCVAGVGLVEDSPVRIGNTGKFERERISMGDALLPASKVGTEKEKVLEHFNLHPCVSMGAAGAGRFQLMQCWSYSRVSRMNRLNGRILTRREEFEWGVSNGRKSVDAKGDEMHREWELEDIERVIVDFLCIGEGVVECIWDDEDKKEEHPRWVGETLDEAEDSDVHWEGEEQ
ncbi:hypothetical protein BDP27DRAFT_1407818 [Rhodocollybia butyracea]|uniref:Uncharacterized protein n=1 Tax=Rhodocollybia butyracea TaxID=206335 RepID=A0A9P5P997_9AGAR|nr:hypothetical protein BDP27DRAFT_1407818 [Rhodocollybia butyracea]